MEIAVVVVGTALMALLWIVVVAAVLMLITYAADWWLGSSVDLLDHPRRNALVLGFVLLIVALCRTFSPPSDRGSESG